MRCREAEALMESGSHARDGGLAEHLLACRACHERRRAIMAGEAAGADLPTLFRGADEGAPTWAELAPLLDEPERAAWLGRWLRAAPTLAAAAVALLAVLAWRWPHEAPLLRTALTWHASPPEGRAPAGERTIDEVMHARPGALESPWVAATPTEKALGGRVDGVDVLLVVARASAPGSERAHENVARHDEGGVTVLSWTQRGQRFALASATRGFEARACTVCHDRTPGGLLARIL